MRLSSLERTITGGAEGSVEMDADFFLESREVGLAEDEEAVDFHLEVEFSNGACSGTIMVSVVSVWN